MRKKKTKITKEFVNSQFKEIKKEKTENENGEQDDEESENGKFENGTEFFGSGSRTAPVISADRNNSPLEQTVANTPSPRRSTNPETENSPPGNVYAVQSNAGTSYATNVYADRAYEAREKTVQVRESARFSGALDEFRISLPEAPRTMPAQEQAIQDWQKQKDTQQIMPGRSEYGEVIDDSKKRMPFERKRRRM